MTRVLVCGDFSRAASFLERIGITVAVRPGTTGFLGPLRVSGSTIYVDHTGDELAGDLLHEGGHISVTPSIFREMLDDDTDAIGPQMSAWLDEHPMALATWPEDPIGRAILQCGEMEAIAWSYAAARAAGVNARLPFGRGFDGNGAEVFGMLEAGAHFGINGLVAGGMTDAPQFRSAAAFPAMKRWLQI